MSEEKKEEPIADKKVSRRSLLKYTGALAAGAVVGVAAEYGATYKPPTPPPSPPPSFKPPLSPDVQARHEQIVKGLQDAHAFDKWVYTNCKQNGCRSDCCILKVFVKNGVIVAVESDPTVNTNNAREDIGLDKIRKGRVQSRLCPMGNGWKVMIYHPNRILYPMKNVGTRGPGAKFVRISWDEALDMIVTQTKTVMDKYGPYSVMSLSTFRGTKYRIGPWIQPNGLAVNAWGEESGSGYTGQKEIMTGGSGSSYGMDDHFNSKLLLLWGQNPCGHTQGNYPYFLRLAKEQGITVVSIDPRYHRSAEVLADQWIPIRPGTDTAMALAIANVLFKEDLYNKNYVAQFVEPTGFQKWKDYILGVTEGPDGKIDRTPEWAEAMCGVPADTIRALARLYAKSYPTKILYGYGAARSDGWNITRALVSLQAMMGYLTVIGGGDPVSGVGPGNTNPVPWPTISWRGALPYPRPILLEDQMYNRAILMREQVNNGQMTEKDFDAWVGNYPGQPMANIKMIYHQCNMQITVWGANSHTEAIKKLDFNWGLGWYPEETCVQYYDLVIPAPIYFFEEPKDETTGTPSSRTRFNSGGGNNNFFIYQEPAIAPLGEVRPIAWWWTELGRRFNIADKYEPLLYDISVGTWKIDEWNKRMEDLHKTAYETWAKLPTITPFHPPTWDDFKKNPFFMVDANPLYSWQAVIAQNQNPFPSRKSYDLTLVPSGKIEIDVPFLADAAKMASTQWEPDGQGCLGRVNTDVVKSMPMWIPQGYGRFLDKRVANYPLTMLSSKTVYRQHSCDDNNPLLRDEAYQHAVWMSVADAKMRGVVDGDLVRVYSEAGETVIPAYVTPRITPGVVDVMAISWYKPSQTKTNLMPDGIDRGGSCNFLIGDPMQEKPDTVTCIKTVQVEVEKF